MKFSPNSLCFVQKFLPLSSVFIHTIFPVNRMCVRSCALCYREGGRPLSGVRAKLPGNQSVFFFLPRCPKSRSLIEKGEERSGGGGLPSLPKKARSEKGKRKGEGWDEGGFRGINLAFFPKNAESEPREETSCFRRHFLSCSESACCVCRSRAPASMASENFECRNKIRPELEKKSVSHRHPVQPHFPSALSHLAGKDSYPTPQQTLFQPLFLFLFVGGKRCIRSFGSGGRIYPPIPPLCNKLTPLPPFPYTPISSQQCVLK